MSFDTLIVGLGVQGKKRKLQLEGLKRLNTLDPFNKEADYSSIDSVQLDAIQNVMLCIPDEEKVGYIDFFINKGMNILVEKPLAVSSEQSLEWVKRSTKSSANLYIAYNHRFEPSLIKMKQAMADYPSEKLYKINIFYGNGTSKLVKASGWRDRGNGVLEDLGSHCLDLINYIFGFCQIEFNVVQTRSFETSAPDNIIILGTINNCLLEIELSLISWKNDFYFEVITEDGSFHAHSLCKWGTASFEHRKRVLPSGKPLIFAETFDCPDPTWKAEHAFFLDRLSNTKSNLGINDWINLNFAKIKRIMAN